MQRLPIILLGIIAGTLLLSTSFAIQPKIVCTDTLCKIPTKSAIALQKEEAKAEPKPETAEKIKTPEKKPCK